MNIENEVLSSLDEALSLQGRSTSFDADTPLLGALPEMDSMAVVTVITTLEERLDLVVNDDDLDAEVFATVGSLTKFVEQKLAEG